MVKQVSLSPMTQLRRFVASTVESGKRRAKVPAYATKEMCDSALIHARGLNRQSGRNIHMAFLKIENEWQLVVSRPRCRRGPVKRS